MVEHSQTLDIMQDYKRLPNSIIPTHYNIELRPNLTTFRFEGNCAISVKVVEPINTIVLNSVDLTLGTTTVKVATGESYIASKINYTLKDETATLEFENTLPVGSAELKIEFVGIMNDNMKGFYRSKYFTAAGEERYAGVTQFEATDARRCFPCWDEPAKKATFNITVVAPTDRVVLSNMPAIKEEPAGDNLRRIVFDTTPIMPTYLVALVIGEYDYIEDTSSDGVLVRVYTPVGKKEQGRFALDIATKVLPYYKEYFHIAYPLPKMDLIAIADFSAGAMENWGLITYRETFVLVDPDHTSLQRKQSIALTVGHEIAHQWFGNLVTMEWWTHLWLNEGYASFVEFLCVNHLFPEYDIWTQFVTEMHTRALELDGLNNSHPVEVVVTNPAEIDEIFDEISYNKGACIIRMLFNYIGDEDFRRGMNIYLTRHKYNNTQTEDLWAALAEASQKPIAQVMSTWTKQKGYPVLTVELKNRVMKMKQEKFIATPLKTDQDVKGYSWLIPINYSRSKAPNDTIKCQVMDKEYIEISIDDLEPHEWVKLNPGSIGFYRVKYSEEMLKLLMPAIVEGQLPPLDRLGLLDDIFAMVQAGQSSTVDVLKLLNAYRNETNYTVWSIITTCLGKINLLLAHTNLTSKLDAFSVKLYSPIADQLGWDAKPNESHMDTLLRSLVINRLVSAGSEKYVKEAKEKFKLHVQGKTLLPADLRSACYKAILQNNDVRTFEEMLDMYRNTDLHEEKDRISRALGTIRDVNILRRVVQFALSDEVRSQDTVFIIIAVAVNPRGRDMTWDFFKTNSAKFLERYQGGFMLARLIKHLTENFTSEEQAKEVEDYFRANHFPGTERTVSQALETVRSNAAWLRRDLAQIEEYLTNEVN